MERAPSAEGSHGHMGKPGRTVGRFEVIDRLGSGGMGATFLAVWNGPHEVQQRVCIKEVNAEGRRVSGHEELFRREAALCASLRHPGIVSVLEVNLDDGFIVYEYIDGCDLRALMAGGRFDPNPAVHVLAQACLALEHAHTRRIGGRSSPVVHRDISPSNLMIDRWGNTKVIDFGIGKAVGERSSGIVKGKLPYMSPEQALAQALDARSDQYSLGVVAYEMLAGLRPNDGADDRETHARILTGGHTPLGRTAPGLPAGLVEVVERMLATDRDDRFASMADVVDALVPFTPPLNVYRELAERVRRVAEPRTIGTEAGAMALVPAGSTEGPSPDAAGSRRARRPLRRPRAASEPPPPAGGISASPAGRPSSVPPPAPSPRSLSPVQVRAATRTLPVEPRGQAASVQGPAPRGDGDGRGARMSRPLMLLAGAISIAAVVGISIAVDGDEEPTVAAANGTTVEPGQPERPGEQAPGTTDEAGPPSLGESQPATGAPATPVAEVSAVEARTPAAGATPARATQEQRVGARAPVSSGSSTSAPAAPVRPVPTPEASSPSLPSMVGAPAETGARGPATTALRRGRLTVGVFPSGNVWLNGRARGAAPLTLEVRAGRHTVGVGTERPTVRRHVRVRAGQESKIVIDLAKAAPSEAP